ncbi:MAG: AraC family transcriptional regulator, partial [Gluconacetobacter diazotrophicus]|nr:AraC family transcriptional regulator [Gluconacetobacter diazotrophicus]
MARMPDDPPITPADTAPRLIELLAFPAVQVLDVAGPLQVFATANEIIAARTGGPGPYALRVVSAAAFAVRTSSGLELLTRPLPPVGEEPPDTLVVAGGPGVEDAAADPILLGWVRERAAGARRTASVCTGALILASAGLLDGRRAATHWSFCDALQKRFPAVRVERDPIFVRDGAVWSSAGVSAGIDLALALVEE